MKTNTIYILIQTSITLIIIFEVIVLSHALYHPQPQTGVEDWSYDPNNLTIATSSPGGLHYPHKLPCYLNETGFIQSDKNAACVLIPGQSGIKKI